METKTEINYVEALTEASIIWEAVRTDVKIEKGKQVASLVKYGIFTDWELAYVLDTKLAVISNATSRYKLSVAHHQRAEHGSVLGPSTVEAVRILANQYHNQKNISGSLLRLVNTAGMDLKSLTRLTGIPEIIIKGVLSGGSYLSGVFRPRA